MFTPTDWIKYALDTCKVPGDVVPIRSLGPSHRERIREHLLELGAQDRYLRFGYHCTDEQINLYVDGLNFSRDEIFGIYNRHLKLLAMAHLALPESGSNNGVAEFGVSVLARSRGRGFGELLFQRSIVHARNAHVNVLFIQALNENVPMLNIVRKAGAEITREGSESECFLRLKPADLDSRVREMMQEQIAQTDYQIKLQSLALMNLLDPRSLVD